MFSYFDFQNIYCNFFILKNPNQQTTWFLLKPIPDRLDFIIKVLLVIQPNRQEALSLTNHIGTWHSLGSDA